jgi:exo-beta-1,3-glucanase (GH17 family)
MESNMKSLIGCLLTLIAFSSWSLNRGINYDPAHSKTYIDAQMANNIDLMKNEISTDMAIVHNKAGFTVIKTFYAGFSTVNGQKSGTIADLACPAGLQIMLGVYEFDPGKDNCTGWCDIARNKEIENAINSVNKYNVNGKNCIIGIAVGNEDIYNWDFTQPNKLIQEHISQDIARLKGALGNKVPIGTAQQDGALLALSKNDPEGIINKLDFIGANIYPYWSKEHPDVIAAQTEFNIRYEAIKNQFSEKRIIVTEEGWPSQYGTGQNSNASILNETAYYQWWQGRSDDFDSYYFAFFDKLPGKVDADKYFGLCTPTRGNKVINQCN